MIKLAQVVFLVFWFWKGMELQSSCQKYMTTDQQLTKWEIMILCFIKERVILIICLENGPFMDLKTPHSFLAGGKCAQLEWSKEISLINIQMLKVLLFSLEYLKDFLSKT